MIEDWENGRPLQSCVFCPSEAGMASTRSEDFTFDSADLLSHKQLEGEEYKKIITVSTAAYLANEARKFNEGIIEEGGKGMSDLNVLQNTHASALAGRMELMENAINFTGDKSTKETLKSYTQILGGELGRRKEELKKTQEDKGKLEKEKEELDERKARLENEVEQIKQDRESLLDEKKKKEEALKKEIELYEEKVKKQSEMAAEYKRTSGELDSLRFQIDQNRTSLANLTDQSATAERIRLRGEQDILKAKSIELERKLGIHETELSRLGGEIEINRERIRHHQEQIQNIHINLNNLNTGLNDLARKLGELEQEYARLKND
ncbi:19811_t:CDS:1 [Entrophospora sp. SA101]|nr:14677_t:CDS:1 [Entrophospora sp. SA101]CAJ0747285.1 19811_t:CDS:1 [Entrophospora sp. SA101]CAJ0832387.1 10193_t:CDS:1 [Entrophospora sp. SA101]CAJ0890687.1 2747_t:CDS:1 [Entrophospora sp. SA101]